MCLFSKALLRTSEVVREDLKLKQDKMKPNYGQTSKAKNIRPDEMVLMLILIPGQLVRARYHGPYDTKVRESNYRPVRPKMVLSFGDDEGISCQI